MQNENLTPDPGSDLKNDKYKLECEKLRREAAKLEAETKQVTAIVPTLLKTVVVASPAVLSICGLILLYGTGWFSAKQEKLENGLTVLKDETKNLEAKRDYYENTISELRAKAQSLTNEIAFHQVRISNLEATIATKEKAIFILSDTTKNLAQRGQLLAAENEKTQLVLSQTRELIANYQLLVSNLKLPLNQIIGAGNFLMERAFENKERYYGGTSYPFNIGVWKGYSKDVVALSGELLRMSGFGTNYQAALESRKNPAGP